MLGNKAFLSQRKGGEGGSLVFILKPCFYSVHVFRVVGTLCTSDPANSWLLVFSLRLFFPPTFPFLFLLFFLLPFPPSPLSFLHPPSPTLYVSSYPLCFVVVVVCFFVLNRVSQCTSWLTWNSRSSCSGVPGSQMCIAQPCSSSYTLYFCLFL